MRCPACACRFDPRNHAVELVPIGATGHLQMINLGRCLRRARNLDQLIDRLLDAVALGPHMADVHAAAPPGLFNQRDEFGCFSIGTRRIDQRGADPERTFRH